MILKFQFCNALPLGLKQFKAFELRTIGVFRSFCNILLAFGHLCTCSFCLWICLRIIYALDMFKELPSGSYSFWSSNFLVICNILLHSNFYVYVLKCLYLCFYFVKVFTLWIVFKLLLPSSYIYVPHLLQYLEGLTFHSSGNPSSLGVYPISPDFKIFIGLLFYLCVLHNFTFLLLVLKKYW